MDEIKELKQYQSKKEIEADYEKANSSLMKGEGVRQMNSFMKKALQKKHSND